MTLKDYINTHFLATDFRVVSFLSVYQNQTFTIGELLEKLDLPRQTLNTILTRLTNANIINKINISKERFAYQIKDEYALDMNCGDYRIIEYLFAHHSQLMTPNIIRLILLLMEDGYYNTHELIDVYQWKDTSLMQATSKLLHYQVIECNNQNYEFNKTFLASLDQGHKEQLSNIEKLLLEKNSHDIKTFYYPHYPDSIDRIMHYFQDPLFDLENRNVGDHDIYYQLYGWQGDHFDCLFSFWYIFSYGIHFTNPDYFPIAEKGNIKNCYKNSNQYGYHYYPSFPAKYINHDQDVVIPTNLLKQQFPEILEIAAIVHSICNFMPVPPLFNQAKGLSIAKDQLNLMVDLIEKCIEDHTPLDYGKQHIDVDVLKQWKKYLMMNREKYALEMFYQYDNDCLKGIPMFDGQSLEHPLPTTIEEYKEYLNSIIHSLEVRNLSLIHKIK